MLQYVAHGLVVESELVMPAFRPASVAGLVVDLTILCGKPPEIWDVGDASLVADDDTSGRRVRIWAAADGRHRVEADGVHLWIDASNRRVHVGHHADADDVVGWLVGGLGLATILALRGHLVLHASMIEYWGRGILLMAPTGHGKSLISAVACSLGARLIAEDTVRLEESEGEWRGFGGSTVLRLRRPIAEVRTLFPGVTPERSSDGRTLVDLEPTLGATRADHAVFVVLDPDVEDPAVTQVDEVTALMAGMAQLRVPGLLAGPVLDCQFDLAGRILSVVPSVTMRVPWSGSVTAVRPFVAACIDEVCSIESGVH